MDTLTHIVLGACIGEAIAGKQLGKKALLLGALAQNIPDIDFVASFWLPTTSDLLAHRGFTHSFLFTILLSPLLAWCSTKIAKNIPGMTYKRWLLFWGLQIFIHIFIDAFNAYGTGWFEPFSHYRVSFNTLFVADPVFSIWPALAMIVLLLIKGSSVNRLRWAGFALGISIAYLFLSICFKLSIDSSVSAGIKNRQIPCTRYFTTPTPLNILLWYIVVENDSGYNIGYKSVLDKRRNINYHFDYRCDSLLHSPCDPNDKARLLRFSQGYYTVELNHDSLIFCDLRFGEILGWEKLHPQPVLYYYLQYPANNKMIVQRGRFQGWNKDAVTRFIKRMRGI